MTKRIEFDGVVHEFPDDFTDDDIAAALDPSYTTGTAPVVQNETPKSTDGPNFVRGLTRLGDLVDMGEKGREARGKFTEGAVGEIASTAVGAARGAFGADVALAAPVAAVAQNFDGQPNRSYAEIQDAIRAQNDRLMSEHPAGAGLGLVTGAVGTGGAAAKAAPQAVKNVSALAAKAAPQAVKNVLALAAKAAPQAVKNVLALAPKVPGANAARVAAMGAGAGALTEANLGGDAEQIQEAAIIGGVTAPVLSKVAKTAIQVAAPSVNRIVTMLDKKTGVSAGIKKLADKMGKVADETAVRGALAQARQQLGREPNAQELFAFLPEKAQKGVVSIAETQPVVQQAAETALTVEELARPERLRAAVQAGGKTGAVEDAQAAQKAMFDKLMADNGSKPVVFQDTSMLNRPALTRSLNIIAQNADSVDQGALLGLVDAIQDGAPATMTLRNVETIRKALSNAIDREPDLKDHLGPVRDFVKGVAAQQIPAYKTVMDLYGKAGDFITGMRQGGKALNQNVTDVQAAVKNAPAMGRTGQAVGLRTEMADRAGESYGRSITAAEQMQNPATVQKVASVIDQAEAERLAAVGGAEAKVARGLEEIAQSADRQPTGDQIAGLALDMVTAIPTGRGSAGMQSNMLKRIINYSRSLGMAENTAKAVGDALFSRNPQTVQAIIQQLARSQNGRKMLAESAAIFGSMAGGQIAAEVVE